MFVNYLVDVFISFFSFPLFEKKVSASNAGTARTPFDVREVPKFTDAVNKTVAGFCRRH